MDISGPLAYVQNKAIFSCFFWGEGWKNGPTITREKAIKQNKIFPGEEDK